MNMQIVPESWFSKGSRKKLSTQIFVVVVIIFLVINVVFVDI